MTGSPTSQQLGFRNHTPSKENLVSIYELCARAKIDCPLLTQWPLRIEILPTQSSPMSWRNLPSRTYSTEISDPLEILKMLAYVAFEWQAREIMLGHNNKSRTPKEREVLAYLKELRC